MLSYCWKYTASIKSKVLKTVNGKTMMLSKCVICGSKNQNLLKSNKQKDY